MSTKRNAPRTLPPLDVRQAMSMFDAIDVVTDEFRELVAKQAPDLLEKLPPKRGRKPAKRKRPTSR